MRRFLAPVLALLAVCCLSTAALADDPSTPSWTLNIPADVAIPYGDPETSIGWVTVSDVENVEVGYIACKISNTRLVGAADTIPLGVAIDWYQDGACMADHMPAGASFALYDGIGPDATYSAKVFALVDAADWAAAAPGYYEAAVTYESYLDFI